MNAPRLEVAPALWTAVLAAEVGEALDWGLGLVQVKDALGLKEISDACGGWIVWRDDDPAFVPRAEWLPMYLKAMADRPSGTEEGTT